VRTLPPRLLTAVLLSGEFACVVVWALTGAIFALVVGLGRRRERAPRSAAFGWLTSAERPDRRATALPAPGQVEDNE
jgi:hypothetical protein